MPVEIYSLTPRSSGYSPAQELAIAVVQQAIRDLKRKPAKLRRWLRSDSAQWWLEAAGVDEPEAFIDYFLGRLPAKRKH